MGGTGIVPRWWGETVADPQVEAGHIRIANDLWEAWTRADLDRNELRVLMAVVRMSYGWGQKDTGARASYSKLQSLTGLVRHRVSAGLRGLLQKRILTRTSQGTTSHNPAVYAPNKDHSSWSPATLPEHWSPETSHTNGTSSTSGTSSTRVTSSIILEPPPPVFPPQRGGNTSPPRGSVSRVWAAFVRYPQQRGRRKSAVPKTWQKDIKARVREFGEEDVIGVIRWAHTSSHRRAVYLRENDCLGHTLFRASKFPDYLNFAKQGTGNGVSDEASPYPEQFTDDIWSGMSSKDRRFWKQKLGEVSPA